MLKQLIRRRLFKIKSTGRVTESRESDSRTADIDGVHRASIKYIMPKVMEGYKQCDSLWRGGMVKIMCDVKHIFYFLS